MKAKSSLFKAIYLIGAIILFFLAIVCMVSFIKAIGSKNDSENPQKVLADSVQVEQLRKEVDELKVKVDSLMTLSQQQPKIKYKYLKPHKDSCVIELNVNKTGERINDNSEVIKTINKTK